MPHVAIPPYPISLCTLPSFLSAPAKRCNARMAIAYGASRLRLGYALCGTEIAYGAGPDRGPGDGGRADVTCQGPVTSCPRDVLSRG
eukprot:585384-Rhodomonas_salina.3